MSFFGSREFYAEVAKGNVPKHSIVHKFGSRIMTTTLSPIAIGGVYQTPTAAAALEVLSSSANDTAAGSGAQEVTIEGLDASWNLISQAVELNGTTAVAIPTSMIRVFRLYVSRSGTYATFNTIATGSHAGTITVRGSGGGATWGQINGSGIFAAQSEIGVYTVPIGYTAFLLSEDVYIDSNKSGNLHFIQRTLASDVATPFTGVRRLIGSFIGVSGDASKEHVIPKGPFAGPCDIGFIGNIGTDTGDAVVEFDLMLVQD